MPTRGLKAGWNVMRVAVVSYPYARLRAPQGQVRKKKRMAMPIERDHTDIDVLRRIQTGFVIDATT